MGVRTRGGFTLFEMLVALVIVAIVAAMTAPSAARLMDAVAFKRKVAALAAAFRYGRVLAVADGRNVVMDMAWDDDGECSFVFREGETEKKRRCYFDPGDEVVFSPELPVRFMADGRVSPVEVTVTSGERRRRLRVDLLTGEPVVGRSSG